ncbi:anthocyanidin 3-O-glucosyltransferase 5-like [Actinidia eriantha]|uniref:anthocyanidin 3-O-glucosyltransferase 5-like n=1 Tax=Actinidia eriantha TaxID=165200 RepID=UPI00258AA918|nr:anthocyanidin 3-O-glucosyltransferase 5-like [Actinidia eriantha]
METTNLHAAMLCSPGMGHLIPVLELGKRLLTNHSLHVTILVVTTPASSGQAHLLLQTKTGLTQPNIIELPPVDISCLITPTTKVVTQLSIIMREARPAIRSALSNMDPQPTIFVADLFGTESFEIAEELRIPKYTYVPSTAWFTALTSYCPVLDKEISGQYVDQTEPLRIPGCRPVRPEVVVDPMLDRTDQQYYEYLRTGVELSLFDGILLNTWEDLERKSLEALRGDEILKPPVYAIGPLTKPVEPDSLNTELLEWLEDQPGESVIFVSFGSGGTLSAEQITELAWGLELSQQRFIWVVRPPIDGHADAAFFKSSDGPDDTHQESNFLPDGFLARTHKVGMVGPMWAPQMRILTHPSVGGFLSHCGWNSTLESLTNGVPIVAWPLYAEQRMNAVVLTEELGVALRTEVLPTKKVVGRREVEKLVRSVMEEGKGMRERAKEVRQSGKNALRKGGSSYNSLCELISDCQNLLNSKDPSNSTNI